MSVLLITALVLTPAALVGIAGVIVDRIEFGNWVWEKSKR